VIEITPRLDSMFLFKYHCVLRSLGEENVGHRSRARCEAGWIVGARNCCTIAAPLTIVLVILSNFFQVKSGCSLFDRFTPTTSVSRQLPTRIVDLRSDECNCSSFFSSAHPKCRNYNMQCKIIPEPLQQTNRESKADETGEIGKLMPGRVLSTRNGTLQRSAIGGWVPCWGQEKRKSRLVML